MRATDRTLAVSAAEWLHDAREGRVNVPEGWGQNAMDAWALHKKLPGVLEQIYDTNRRLNWELSPSRRPEPRADLVQPSYKRVSVMGSISSTPIGRLLFTSFVMPYPGTPRGIRVAVLRERWRDLDALESCLSGVALVARG